MPGRVSRLLADVLAPSRRDAAFALALAAVAEGEVLARPLRPLAVAVPFALLWTLPLAFRRRAPLAVLAVVLATFPVQHWLGVPIGNSDLASVIAGITAIYSAGAHLALRRAVAGLAFAIACLAVGVARGSGSGGLAGGIVWVAIIAGGAWLAGRGMRAHRLQAGALARLAHALELEREEKARTAAAEERARIARELHDVVAHAVSVMVVQAGAAEQVLDEDPARARDALGSVQQTGRQALVELRRLLGVLRTDDTEPTLQPQPGLGELGALAEQVREAGVPVSVRIEGESRPLQPGLDLAAYRIVQEALTNVLKHASATSAEVAVRYAGDVLELDVLDDGRGAARTNGRGHGLVGMRERASLYGGEVEAGPRPGGGFAVRVRLPVAGAG